MKLTGRLAEAAVRLMKKHEPDDWQKLCNIIHARSRPWFHERPEIQDDPEKAVLFYLTSNKWMTDPPDWWGAVAFVNKLLETLFLAAQSGEITIIVGRGLETAELPRGRLCAARLGRNVWHLPFDLTTDQVECDGQKYDVVNIVFPMGGDKLVEVARLPHDVVIGALMRIQSVAVPLAEPRLTRATEIALDRRAWERQQSRIAARAQQGETSGEPVLADMGEPHPSTHPESAQSPARASAPRLRAPDVEVRKWYEGTYIPECQTAGKRPSEAKDWAKAKLKFGNKVRRNQIRELRHALAPDDWRIQGRRPSSPNSAENSAE